MKRRGGPDAYGHEEKASSPAQPLRKRARAGDRSCTRAMAHDSAFSTLNYSVEAATANDQGFAGVVPDIDTSSSSDDSDSDAPVPRPVVPATRPAARRQAAEHTSSSSSSSDDSDDAMPPRPLPNGRARPPPPPSAPTRVHNESDSSSTSDSSDDEMAPRRSRPTNDQTPKPLKTPTQTAMPKQVTSTPTPPAPTAFVPASQPAQKQQRKRRQNLIPRRKSTSTAQMAQTKVTPVPTPNPPKDGTPSPRSDTTRLATKQSTVASNPSTEANPPRAGADGHRGSDTSAKKFKKMAAELDRSGKYCKAAKLYLLATAHYIAHIRRELTASDDSNEASRGARSGRKSATLLAEYAYYCVEGILPKAEKNARRGKSPLVSALSRFSRALLLRCLADATAQINRVETLRIRWSRGQVAAALGCFLQQCLLGPQRNALFESEMVAAERDVKALEAMTGWRPRDEKTAKQASLLIRNDARPDAWLEFCERNLAHI